ncbi:MAG: hypothetical protein J6S85_02565 [Methanobrevibacter sp.]|nr:hypothetical protein [Methanobrevibacter sp.]
MINIESKVIAAVKAALSTDYPDLLIYSMMIPSPESFPCVCVEEIDNYIYKDAMTTSHIENVAEVTYEVNVYSNSKTGKKSEAKAIFEIIDTTLSDMGFIREYTKPVTMDNGTVYRFTARYTTLATQN